MRTLRRRPHLLSSRPIRIAAQIAVLLVALSPLTTSHASGIIWLPTQAATGGSFAYLHPSFASMHDHAYILSTNEPGGEAATVSLTTNESGSWKTQTLSTQGPKNAYSAEFSALAADPSTNQLYAVWIYQKDADTFAVGVWTRDSAGHWSGPTDVAMSGFIGGQPAVVAGGGKVYVSYVDSALGGACDDSSSRAGDVFVVSFDRQTWSTPQNLTSCVNDPNAGAFEDPKLALDTDGRAYLVSLANNNNLWYMDTASGAWSQPQQITQSIDVEDYIGSPAFRDTYGIAASNGTAFVAYAQFLTLNGSNNGSDIFLLSHPAGDPWTSASHLSPADPGGCAKWGISLAAQGGRVGVAYVMASSGGCHGAGPSHTTPYLMTGTPDHLAMVAVDGGKDCGDTSLGAESNLFRLVLSCGGVAPSGSGNLYYQREFLDVSPPMAHLSGRVVGRTIHLRWSAHDPSPGAGVAGYQLQVRHGSSGWHTLSQATRATSLVYRPVYPGQAYSFRLRARDGVNNWSAWVVTTVHIR